MWELFLCSLSSYTVKGYSQCHHSQDIYKITLLWSSPWPVQLYWIVILYCATQHNDTKYTFEVIQDLNVQPYLHFKSIWQCPHLCLISGASCLSEKPLVTWRNLSQSCRTKVLSHSHMCIMFINCRRLENIHIHVPLYAVKNTSFILKNKMKAIYKKIVGWSRQHFQ